MSACKQGHCKQAPTEDGSFQKAKHIIKASSFQVLSVRGLAHEFVFGAGHLRGSRLVEVDVDVEVGDDVGNETKVSFLFNFPCQKNEKCHQRGAPQMPGTLFFRLQASIRTR